MYMNTQLLSPTGTSTPSAPGMQRSADSNAEWNRYLDVHPGVWVTTTNAWANVLTNTFPSIQSSPLIFRKDGKITGGLRLFRRNTLLHGRKWVSIPFATLSDPLVQEEPGESFTQKQLDQALQALNSDTVEINTFFTDNHLLPDNFTCKQSWIVHEIDLMRSEEEILHSFHRSCIRQHIRKSEKEGFKFTEATSIGELRVFYNLYLQTRKRLGLPAMPELFFRNCLRHLVPQGNARFFTAELNGKPVAALMGLTFGDRFSAETLGWDHDAQKSEPVIALFWHVIQWAKSHSCRVFDFGRTDECNSHLMSFKDHWGTTRRQTALYTNAPRKKNGGHPVLQHVAGAALRALPTALYRMASSLYYR